MAATGTALIQQLFGASLAAALPQVGGPAQNIDVLQIVDQGGSCLINVDYTGAVHNPAVAPTQTNNGTVGATRLGVFQSSITSGTTAQIFAATFTNPSNQDILQVFNIGGNISYYLDYLGVAHGS